MNYSPEPVELDRPSSCHACGAPLPSGAEVCARCGTAAGQLDAGQRAAAGKAPTGAETSRPPLSMPVVVTLLLALAAVAYGIYSMSYKAPDYAADPHAGMPTDRPIDTLAIMQKQLALNHVIDSLEHEAKSSDEALLQLAGTYYEAQQWSNSRKSYEAFLKKHPQESDARIEYAVAIMESESDGKLAMDQLEIVLKREPNNVRALFNAGITALRMGTPEQHEAALAKSKIYFLRAKKSAQTQAPDLVPKIDKILETFESLPKAKGG